MACEKQRNALRVAQCITQPTHIHKHPAGLSYTTETDKTEHTYTMTAALSKVGCCGTLST